MPPRWHYPWRSASPLAGMDGIEQFEAVRWGRRPKRLVSVSTPALRRAQELVEMGRLRALYVVYGDGACVMFTPPKPYPYLAFGASDNRLYIVGGCTDKMAKKKAWGRPGESGKILRVDYDSVKGRTSAYWYHDHEPPYPTLRVLPSGHPAYRGGRYKVAPEGITG